MDRMKEAHLPAGKRPVFTSARACSASRLPARDPAFSACLAPDAGVAVQVAAAACAGSQLC